MGSHDVELIEQPLLQSSFGHSQGRSDIEEDALPPGSASIIAHIIACGVYAHSEGEETWCLAGGAGAEVDELEGGKQVVRQTLARGLGMEDVFLVIEEGVGVEAAQLAEEVFADEHAGA